MDSYKICPACKLAAVLEAPICAQCRHRFRMPFDGSEETTTTLEPGKLCTCVGKAPGLLPVLLVVLLVLGGVAWWFTHR